MPKNIRRFIHTEFTMSVEQYENGWDMPFNHYHNDYEIYILEKGIRSVRINEKEYVTEALDAALFPPNHPHGSRGESAFSGICIHFSRNYLGRYLTPSAGKQLLACFNTPVIALPPDAFAAIKNYAEHFVLSAPDNFVILIRILHLLNTLGADSPAANSSQTENTAVTSEAPCTASKARRILSYTANNYTSIASVRQLAELFDTSESYIFKVFRQTCGKTPKEYINELRLNNACYRLQNTDGTIAGIAEECGYECYEYFTRLFKKHKGVTPSEYRRNFRNS